MKELNPELFIERLSNANTYNAIIELRSALRNFDGVEYDILSDLWNQKRKNVWFSWMVSQS